MQYSDFPTGNFPQQEIVGNYEIDSSKIFFKLTTFEVVKCNVLFTVFLIMTLH